MTDIPKVGMRFNHSRWLDTRVFDGKTPQLMQVTRIARGTVYYRAVYSRLSGEELGMRECCPVDKFHTVVQK